jgi:broad specificity phosphatase PhoE
VKRIVLLIRHGQTTWNVQHRLPGQLPGIELTATGRAQAQRLAEALRVLPLSAIISSPLERAAETARFLARGRDLIIHYEPDLVDIELGHWSGRVFDDLDTHDAAWKAFVRNPTIAPLDVETFPALEERVVAAVERWLQREPTGVLPAFVAHADVIKLLLAHYTGLEAGRARSLLIDNASVSVVELKAGQPPRVRAIGWSPAPTWLEASVSVSEHPVSEEHVDGEQKT